MKIKLTATLTYETDVDLEDYAEFENAPQTEADIIAWELRQVSEGDSDLLDVAAFDGEISNVKIEEIEADEKAEAA